MATELKVPALGESITEAVIAKWLKKVGEPTAADEPVVDLETDKVSVQLPAPAAGVLLEQKYPQGATVKVGDVIGMIAAGATAVAVTDRKPSASIGAATIPPGAMPSAPSAPPAPAAPIAAPPAAPPHDPVHVSTGGTPSQRKAARENGAAAPPAATRPTIPPPQAAPSIPMQAPRAGALEEVVAMSPLRKRIAERLVEAQHTAAILTTFNEVDMTAVFELRARYQDEFVAKHGIKLGFMSFFVKAAVESAKNWPGINAEVRGTDVIYKKHYDVGVAVGGGKGLVVPVVRDADKLSFAELEKTIAALAAKAKDNKLTLEELSGGTFTVSNGGIYGSMMSSTMLNMPQTGILGMHNIVKRAVVISDKAGDRIEIRPMMYIALSYDHRVVDGREAVSFLVGVKQRVESPERLLFGV